MIKQSSAHLVRIGIVVGCLAEVIGVPNLAWAEVAAVGGMNFASSDSSSVTASCLRMVGALFFCLGVFAGGIHLYRRFATKGGGGSKRRLVVRERLALSSKSSLTLVSLDGKEFVVASGSEHVTLIPTNAITANSFSEALTEETELEEVFNA